VPPSRIDTHEFVVPRSMPMIFAMLASVMMFSLGPKPAIAGTDGTDQ